jgi:hypothetical protein
MKHTYLINEGRESYPLRSSRCRRRRWLSEHRLHRLALRTEVRDGP